MPGVIAQLHPDEQRRVVAEGHEIGMHGWIHEGTSELTESSERDLMRRAFDTLTKVTGRTPVGIRVPSWDFSATTLPLIRELGLLYDSLMVDSPDEASTQYCLICEWVSYPADFSSVTFKLRPEALQGCRIWVVALDFRPEPAFEEALQRELRRLLPHGPSTD